MTQCSCTNSKCNPRSNNVTRSSKLSQQRVLLAICVFNSPTRQRTLEMHLLNPANNRKTVKPNHKVFVPFSQLKELLVMPIWMLLQYLEESTKIKYCRRLAWKWYTSPRCAECSRGPYLWWTRNEHLKTNLKNPILMQKFVLYIQETQ
jgi:hypothetical protein